MLRRCGWLSMTFPEQMIQPKAVCNRPGKERADRGLPAAVSIHLATPLAPDPCVVPALPRKADSCDQGGALPRCNRGGLRRNDRD